LMPNPAPEDCGRTGRVRASRGKALRALALTRLLRFAAQPPSPAGERGPEQARSEGFVFRHARGTVLFPSGPLTPTARGDAGPPTRALHARFVSPSPSAIGEPPSRPLASRQRTLARQCPGGVEWCR